MSQMAVRFLYKPLCGWGGLVKRVNIFLSLLSLRLKEHYAHYAQGFIALKWLF